MMPTTCESFTRLLLGCLLTACCGGPASAADPPEGIHGVLHKAGFKAVGSAQADADGVKVEWRRELPLFVRFGSMAASEKYLRGDKFDKIEVERASAGHRESLRGRRFAVKGLKFESVVTDSVETKGLFVQVTLPMRVRGGERFRGDAAAMTGVLAAVHASEADTWRNWFLDKAGKVRPCTPAEAAVVRRNDGVLYHPEVPDTTLILVLKDKLEALKAIARGPKDYEVQIDFSELRYERPAAWGYFRADAYFGADGDCEKLWEDYLADEASPQPVYFATALGKGGEAEIPQLVRSRLDALRVVDRDGKVVGGYRVGK